MKLAKSLILLLSLSLFMTACANEAGPLAPGMSRIKVKGSGLFEYKIDAIATGSSVPADSKTLSCFVYCEENLDVPVPPTVYDVRADRQTFKTVTFSGPGETKTVYLTEFTITIPISF